MCEAMKITEMGKIEQCNGETQLKWTKKKL